MFFFCWGSGVENYVTHSCHVSPAPLGYNDFSDFLYLWWPWQLEECWWDVFCRIPTTWDLLDIFLMIRKGYYVVFEEDCRSKCHFHHTVSRIHSVDLSLLMLISIIRLSGICQASPLWSVLSYLFLLCTPEGSCLVQARLDADIAFLPFEGRVSYALLRILHKRFVYCPSLTHFSTQSFIYINVD